MDNKKNFLFLIFACACFLFLAFMPFSKLFATIKENSFIFLSPTKKIFSLENHLSVLKDPNGHLSIENVSAQAMQANFSTIPTKNINLGLSEATFWIRLPLNFDKKNHESKNLFLKIDRCQLNICRLFIPEDCFVQNGAGHKWRIIDSSITKSKISKNTGISCSPIIFDLPVCLQGPKVFYLQIHEPNGGLYLPLSLGTEEAINKYSSNKAMGFGMYYGIMLVMLLFNLFLYLFIGEKIRLYYVFYIASVGTYFFLINKIYYQNFNLSVNDYDLLTIIFLFLTIFWGTFFAKSFLNTKANAPFLNKLFIAVLVLALGTLFLSPILHFLYLNQMGSILGMASPVLIITAGLICWRRGFKPIFYFLLAWIILCISGFIYALTYRGTLPYTIPTFYSFQIGSCIEVIILSFALGQRLQTLRQEKNLIREMFGRYVSEKICDEILNGRVPVEGAVKEVTILISDLRDYTHLAESLSPGELVKVTNIYLAAMVKVIEENKGLILNYVGDSIQAVFGAPLPVEFHPEKAVLAGLAMRLELKSVNKELKKMGFQSLRHGIGIHTGYVTAANIGSPDRLSYTVSGVTVNIASRLQDLNKQFGTDILISDKTRSLIGTSFYTKSLGKVQVKGLSEHLQVFSLTHFQSTRKS